jgi:pimeloyl-ACP methyl ester carboxylesterase
VEHEIRERRARRSAGRKIVGGLLAVLVGLGPAAVADTFIGQPDPPPGGPGSTKSPKHQEVTISGSSARPGDYVLYEPSKPKPASAPVVVFLHGAQLSDGRSSHEPLIRNLVKNQGYVVLYAEEGTNEAPDYAKHARTAIRNGLAKLAEPGHVHHDKKHLGFIGFSLGGMVAMRLAAEPKTDFPAPGVVVLHDPAGRETQAITGVALTKEALRGMAASTKLLIIQAESSRFEKNSASPDAWNNAPSRISKDNKSWLRVPSDDHGTFDMKSEHASSAAPVDAVDWWGYWRPTEGALIQCFTGKAPAGYSAFCNSLGPTRCASVRKMGTWSDRIDVKRMLNFCDIVKADGGSDPACTPKP